MNYNLQADKLAGPIGLLKQYGSLYFIKIPSIEYSRFVSRTGRETAEGEASSQVTVFLCPLNKIYSLFQS